MQPIKYFQEGGEAQDFGFYDPYFGDMYDSESYEYEPLTQEEYDQQEADYYGMTVEELQN